nr:uncharacterized protein LOC102415513 isoform X3 [Bubalus bubalis]XP_025150818.1 uncharacterized protein LOC102415513 isoform X3 [Bubalus bubalis]
MSHQSPRLPGLRLSACFSPPSPERGRTEVTQSHVNSPVAPAEVCQGCGHSSNSLSFHSGPRSDPQKKEVPPPQIPAIQQKPNLSARDRRKRGFRLPSGSGRSAGGRQMTQSFSTALKLDMPYNMRFSWSGSKSIFQRTGCMLHNLQQASVDPQLNDGVGEGDRGEGGEAAREPASKRTKCCRLFLVDTYK